MTRSPSEEESVGETYADARERGGDGGGMRGVKHIPQDFA